MIFFVPISTLVDKDTGLCIGPVDHFPNNRKAIHPGKNCFLYGGIWNAFYKYLHVNPSTTLYLQMIDVFNSDFFNHTYERPVTITKSS